MRSADCGPLTAWPGRADTGGLQQRGCLSADCRYLMPAALFAMLRPSPHKQSYSNVSDVCARNSKQRCCAADAQITS